MQTSTDPGVLWTQKQTGTGSTMGIETDEDEDIFSMSPMT